jgi:hypothetical protein
MGAEQKEEFDAAVINDSLPQTTLPKIKIVGLQLTYFAVTAIVALLYITAGFSDALIIRNEGGALEKFTGWEAFTIGWLTPFLPVWLANLWLFFAVCLLWGGSFDGSFFLGLLGLGSALLLILVELQGLRVGYWLWVGSIGVLTLSAGGLWVLKRKGIWSAF